MEEFEVSAKTVDEAIEQALNQLQVDRSEIQIEVLSKGKQGIFGFGSEEARIRVKPQVHIPAEEVAGLAKEVLEKILSLMKVQAAVSLRQDSSEEGLVLDVTGNDLGILIGRRGDTLSSLQYVVNLIVSRELKFHAGISVDVERYRQRRYDSLRNLALRVADEVSLSEHSIGLEPMPSWERRIVHLALHDDLRVTTQSVGQGESRKVVISLKMEE